MGKAKGSSTSKIRQAQHKISMESHGMLDILRYFMQRRQHLLLLHFSKRWEARNQGKVSPVYAELGMGCLTQPQGRHKDHSIQVVQEPSRSLLVHSQPKQASLRTHKKCWCSSGLPKMDAQHWQDPAVSRVKSLYWILPTSKKAKKIWQLLPLLDFILAFPRLGPSCWTVLSQTWTPDLTALLQLQGSL